MFRQYYQNLEDNELQHEVLIEDLAKSFETLYNFFNCMNSEGFCSLITYNSTYVSGTASPNQSLVDCKSAHYGVLTSGLETCLNVMLLEINSIYYQFLSALDTNNASHSLTLLNSGTFVDLLDVHAVFLNQGSDALAAKMTDGGYSLFSSANSFDTYDIVAFCLLLTFMFMIVLRFFLNSFKLSIWKTKRMLGILPTKYIAGQLLDVKTLIRQIS